MLINLRTLCNKYKFIPKGIIHIGAHKAEELETYDSLGIEDVVWVEGNPDLFEALKERLKPFNKQLALNYLVSDQDGKEYEFKITNNGESSSILELDKHLTYHPHIHVVETKKLFSKKADTIVKDHEIDMSKYDFLNLDIQGAELMALKGFMENLHHLKYVYTEVNEDSVYEGCALMSEIDEFLGNYGFERIETSMTEYKWGDAFYKKK